MHGDFVRQPTKHMVRYLLACPWSGQWCVPFSLATFFLIFSNPFLPLINKIRIRLVTVRAIELLPPNSRSAPTLDQTGQLPE